MSRKRTFSDESRTQKCDSTRPSFFSNSISVYVYIFIDTAGRRRIMPIAMLSEDASN